MSYQCKRCGSEVSEDAHFCAKCGEKVTVFCCPNCGKRLPGDSTFCTYCGSKIVAEQTEAPQPEVQQPSNATASVPAAVVSSEENQFSAEYQQVVNSQEDIDPKTQPAEGAAFSSSGESAKKDVEFNRQQVATAETEMITTSDNDIDEAAENPHHYHLTRRKLRFFNVWAFFSEFEETDIDVNNHTITISDHLLSKDTPEVTQFPVLELRQIFVGRTVSIPWLCSALFFTILLLMCLTKSDVHLYSVRGYVVLPIFAIMSWPMAWYRTITLYFKDGQKIAIRGRERNVMEELRQDLLSRVEAEPNYTGDLSEIVVKNTQYYLPEFEKARYNEKCRFNWAAFFFSGIFAYYRKSQEVFWHYYKWPFAIYAIIVLGISGSSFLAFKSDAGLAGWMVAVALLSVAINIYLLVTNIRFGKNFNREYYQHCMVQAGSSEITPRTVGTSTKNAILYWIVMSLCVGLIVGMAGTLAGAAIIGGLPDNIWDNGNIYQDSLTESDIAGCWEVTEIVEDGRAYPVDNSREDGLCLIFHTDHTAELYYFENGRSEVVGAVWEWDNETVQATVPDYDTVNIFRVEGDCLILDTEDGTIEFAKTLDNAKLPDYLQSDAASQSTITLSNFVGDYSYDASFENPDGSWTDFLYSLRVEPGNGGVFISEVWRGIYSFCDNWASQDDLDGDTLYFVVKYGDNAGTHSLTYVPAAQSLYGSDTIYIDGNADMPFTKAGYVDNSYPYWDDSYGDSYILPTDTQYITESDLYGMSKEQVSLARNEIYARYGYSFKNADIRNYFMLQSWYYEDPSVNANTFGTSNLSDCERANLETIQQYERDMGWK